MSRRKKEEEHENHERWLVSYADFITLLFAFFVVMYSISSVNEGKYKVLSQTLVAAFTGQPTTPQPIRVGPPGADAHRLVDLPPLPQPTSLVPVPDAKKPPQGPRDAGDPVQQQLDQVAQTLRQRLAPQIGAGQINVRMTGQGIVIDIHDSLLFASGDATLSGGAQSLLLQIADVLTALPYQIQVNGYTDNKPISNAQFASNWQLSAMRAVTVVQMLIAQRVSPEQLVAAGYGQYHPVASNATPQGRASNRRVSIVVVSPEASAQSLPSNSGNPS
jgi:chemotaxis protein MotB